ncbi:hypothetical protein TNCV_4235091 [Trichonephila clavipes]|nr:hypothetical protein TNCV_4235091 [Trichonephila clavipes]
MHLSGKFNLSPLLSAQPSAQPLERILTFCSAPLRDDVTPPDKRFTSDVTPINHHAPTTLLRKARLLASHNELSRLSTISPKTANELMIKHFEHFGQ